MVAAGWVQSVRARSRALNSRSRDCTVACHNVSRASRTSHSTDAGVAESLSKHQLDLSPKEHWFVQSTWFKATMGVVVVANIFQMGISLDLRGGSWDEFWQITEYVFAFFFGLEMMLKIIFLKLDYFKDRWNWLEFVLAWLAICDAAVIAAGFKGAATQVTILRLLRLARVLRTARVFRICKELVVLVEAIVKSMRTMVWLLVLVGLFLYVTSIFCVEMIGSDKSYPSYNTDNLDSILEGFNNYEYFGSILRSMHTLFNMATLNEWSIITRPLAQEQPWLVFVLVAFTMLTAYGIMNVLIGVIVEHALAANANFMSTKEAEHKASQMHLIDVVATFLTQCDANNDGCITLEEFEDAINNNGTLAHLLSQVDLPEGCTIKELFMLIDEDGNATIDKNEFVSAMHRLLYCDDFHRLCLMQMSLNRIKYCVRDVMKEVKLLYQDQDKTRQDTRSSTGHAWPNIGLYQDPAQKKEGIALNSNGCPPSDGERLGHTSESGSQVINVPGMHTLHGELQELRAEISIRLADLNALLVRMTDLGAVQQGPWPQSHNCPIQLPLPVGLPPTLAIEAHDQCGRICQPESASLTAELPGMMPPCQDEDAACAMVVAAPLLPDVVSIISELEATVAELQWHSELGLSSRKRELEGQAAMRACCSKLVACAALKQTSQDDACSVVEDVLQTRMSPALVESQAASKEAPKHAEPFRQKCDGYSQDPSLQDVGNRSCTSAALQMPGDAQEQQRQQS